MPRCPRCKNPLAFAGLTKAREQVLKCLTTFFRYDKNQTISVPCSPDGEYVVGSAFVKAVAWLPTFTPPRRRKAA